MNIILGAGFDSIVPMADKLKRVFLVSSRKLIIACEVDAGLAPPSPTPLEYLPATMDDSYYQEVSTAKGRKLGRFFSLP